MSDPIVGPEPRDRLTRLCKVMTDALEGDPEMQTHGYEDTREALVALMTQVTALFEASGIRMEIELVTIPDDVGDLDGA